MPKENTHVFFANEVLGRIKKDYPEIGNLIKNNFYQYQIGSYLPDIFFYDKKLSKISKIIHGQENNPTNYLIFHLLDKIEFNDQKSLSFIFGTLTHFALDITFHPMVNRQSKNFYGHIHFETALDKKINACHNLLLPVKKKAINSIKAIRILERYFKIKTRQTEKIYRRHYFYNKIFRSFIAYMLFRLLKKVYRPDDKSKLGLFYGNLFFDKIKIKNKYSFTDLKTGKIIRQDLSNLLNKSCQLTRSYIISAYSYKKGEINKTNLANIIRGENLSTGKIIK